VPTREERVAELTIRFGTNVQPDQVVLVTGEPEQLELMRLIADEAYRAGAKVVDVWVFDPHVKRSRLLYAPEDTLEWVPPWYGARQTTVDELRGARIAVAGDTAVGIFDEVDPKRAGKDRLPTTPESLAVTNERTTNWCVVPGPSPGWAAAVFPELLPEQALDRLWGEVEHVLRLDEPDPVAAWEARRHEAQAPSSRVDRARPRLVVFSGPGTDLTVGLLPSSRWWAADFTTRTGCTTCRTSRPRRSSPRPTQNAPKAM